MSKIEALEVKIKIGFALASVGVGLMVVSAMMMVLGAVNG